MTQLPEPVAQAYAALRAGAWHDARTHVVAALAAIEEPSLRARLHGWHAQVLAELGELAEARVAVRRALLGARELGDDPAALAPLKALHGRITAMLSADDAAARRQAEARALAARPLAELLEEASEPLARAGVYLARADALADQGQAEAVSELVALGLAEAPAEAVREQVLLRLAWLRVHPPHTADLLAEALQLAEDAASETLVTACARAARDLGLALPEPEF